MSRDHEQDVWGLVFLAAIIGTAGSGDFGQVVVERAEEIVTCALNKMRERGIDISKVMQ